MCRFVDLAREGLAFTIAAAAVCVAGLGAQAPPNYDAEFARLKQGRPYTPDVKTGTLRRRHGAYPYWLVVPATYDPAKKYPVRIQLHGGVMREDAELRGDGSVRLPENPTSGRVDLTRHGNTVTAATRGVKAFTLLISPDQFDFNQNIVVRVNGRVAFDARVEKSVETLAQVGGARQRSHDAVRRRDQDSAGAQALTAVIGAGAS